MAEELVSCWTCQFSFFFGGGGLVGRMTLLGTGAGPLYPALILITVSGGSPFLEYLSFPGSGTGFEGGVIL